MSTVFKDDGTREIAEAMARALNVPFATLEAYVEEAARKRRAKAAAQNARFSAALTRLTDRQVALLQKHECDGATLDRLFVNRRTNNVAAMLVKPRVWDGAKGKMAKKLIVLYPDGSSAVTLERSISMKETY